MTEAELSRRLAREPVPGEEEGAERAWQTVSSAFASRERVPRTGRPWRPILAFAVLAALLAAAVTQPGRAFVERLRDAVGLERSEPVLVRLPAPGNLLVESSQGPWVVHRDGSKRLLGAYDEASWSPQGKFVVVTRSRQIAAVEPGGKVHWVLVRRDGLANARWAPSGFRIAYREGTTLRVVIGDGTGDRLLASSVAAVAPAWRPRPSAVNAVAYADLEGRVHVVNVDTRRAIAVLPARSEVRQIQWSRSGSRLLVLTDGRIDIYSEVGNVFLLSKVRGPGGAVLDRTIRAPRGDAFLEAAFVPAGRGIVYTDFDPSVGRSQLILARRERGQRILFRGAGRLGELAWSPNGAWLLVTWPAADEWLFLRMPGVRRITTVSSVTAQFDPAGTGPRTFPRIEGWVKPEAS